MMIDKYRCTHASRGFSSFVVGKVYDTLKTGHLTDRYGAMRMRPKDYKELYRFEKVINKNLIGGKLL